MKILLLITNLGPGGAQKVFYDHATMLSKHYLVEEVVFDEKRDERIYNSGLRLHDLRRDDFWSRLGSFGRLISRAMALKRLVATHAFDVVISHMDGANLVNVLSGSRARKLLVVHGTVLHDQGLSKFHQWLRTHIGFPWLYNLAEQTVAVSAGIGSELNINCGVRKVCVIKNFFDFESIMYKAKLHIESPHKLIFEQNNIIITSSRLVKEKNHSLLIDILNILLHKKISVRLVILGDGPLRNNIMKKCVKLGLKVFDIWSNVNECHAKYDVYFLGHVSNPYQYIARSTLFVFPSAWEGFPLALCEAMICGVPVLSADCATGPREILAPAMVRNTYDLRQAEIAQNGILLPLLKYREDLTIWANAIQELLGAPELRARLVECAVQFVKRLDPATAITCWRTLIDGETNAQ